MRVKHKYHTNYEPTGINNFHNSGPIKVRILDYTFHNSSVYIVSRAQAQRIKTHFCGISDCKCGQGAVQQLDPEGIEFGIEMSRCSDLLQTVKKRTKTAS